MKTLKTLLLVAMVGFMSMGTTLAGSEESQVRNLKGFHAIKVSSGIDLFLTMGNSEEVKIVADEDIIDNIRTEVKDGTLHIYMKNTNNWFNWSGNKARKAYVSVKELERLEASSGSDVECENTLEGDELAVKVSSGADVKLDVHYRDFSIDTSSGSDAKIRGKVKHLTAESSSGSDIDAKELEAVACKASASSGSDISVRVSDEIVARASSGADIVYYGDPQVKDIDESSGGDVHKR